MGKAGNFVDCGVYLGDQVGGELLPQLVPHPHDVLAVAAPGGVPHHQARPTSILRYH